MTRSNMLMLVLALLMSVGKAQDFSVIGYNLEFEGNVSENTGEARQFTSTTDSNAVLGVLQVTETQQCAELCNGVVVCVAFVIDTASITTCRLLRSSGFPSGELTTAVSRSYQKQVCVVILHALLTTCCSRHHL